MLNSRTKWILALLELSLAVIACSKKEETKTEYTKQAAPTEQKSMPMEQTKEQAAASSTAASDSGKSVYQNTCASCHERASLARPRSGTKRHGKGDRGLHGRSGTLMIAAEAGRGGENESIFLPNNFSGVECEGGTHPLIARGFKGEAQEK